MNEIELAALNQRFAIYQADIQLRIENGTGDLPIIHLRNPHAVALISLYGAQILSYRPHDAAQDLMFLSEKALYQKGKAIRGGAPLCWPWFGADADNRGRPSHGFARTSLWQLTTAEIHLENTTRIVLELNDTADTRTLWPYRFKLELEIIIGAALELKLTTHNLNDHPLTISQAIHTYFAIGNIEQTSVHGLENCHYIDKSKLGNNSLHTQKGVITVEQEVDRIYLNTPNTVRIHDHQWQRNIIIQSIGSQSTVVWNPWIDIAASMADLNDNDYQRFICVETTNVESDIVKIAPQAIYGIKVKYSIEL